MGELKELLAVNPVAKALVFSNWRTLLRVSAALSENGIACTRLDVKDGPETRASRIQRKIQIRLRQPVALLKCYIPEQHREQRGSNTEICHWLLACRRLAAGRAPCTTMLQSENTSLRCSGFNTDPSCTVLLLEMRAGEHDAVHIFHASHSMVPYTSQICPTSANNIF